jgi:hypothetical protein
MVSIKMPAQLLVYQNVKALNSDFFLLSTVLAYRLPAGLDLTLLIFTDESFMIIVIIVWFGLSM